MHPHDLAVNMGRVIRSRVSERTHNKDVLEIVDSICSGLVDESWDGKGLQSSDVRNLSLEEAALIYLQAYLPKDWEIKRDVKKLSLLERLLGRKDILRYERAIRVLRQISAHELLSQKEKAHAQGKVRRSA
jgi:hypothetical protein